MQIMVLSCVRYTSDHLSLLTKSLKPKLTVGEALGMVWVVEQGMD